jgi:hypothetical protein
MIEGAGSHNYLSLEFFSLLYWHWRKLGRAFCFTQCLDQKAMNYPSKEVMEVEGQRCHDIEPNLSSVGTYKQ